MSDDLSLNDLAEQILRENPRGRKHEWGESLLSLAEEHDDPEIAGEVRAQIVSSLGGYVSAAKARHERSAYAQRLLDRGVAYNGRPLSPTISVRNEDGTSALTLWIEAPPRQFIEAVFREQRVVDGRNRANKVRRLLAAQMQADEALLDLPNLAAVCQHAGIDPDTLGLDELESA